MKKTLLFIFLIVISISNLHCQSFPYSNASTGNENEFPVDKDTNIYMFHGNRLVKTDKNFNVIWANTYSGFNFSSLLLSKTGSMYFIGSTGAGKTYYGKINSNGTLNWIKNTQNISALLSGSTTINYFVDCNKLLLDRNYNLVVTGYNGVSTSSSKGFLIKTDTNGNTIKFKCFNPNGINYLNKLAVLEDSLGYYRFIGSAFFAMGPAIHLAMYRYNDNADVFINNNSLFYINIPFGFEWRLVKSKLNSGFYIHSFAQDANSYIFNGMTKFTNSGQKKWSKEFARLNGSLYAFAGHLEESINGDLFLTMTTGNALQFYTSAVVKSDSNGVILNSATSLISSYNIAPTYMPPTNSVRVIHANNYYFDVTGNNFPSNPLTIQKFNSSLVLPCSSSMTFTLNSTSNFSVAVNSPTLEPITSYTILAVTSFVTPITFSVNTNFCTVLNMNQFDFMKMEDDIFPNPTNGNIYFSQEENYIEIMDVNGKNIKSESNVSSLDVSDLATGIYFIRIKNDNGVINKKFIKE